ncbi:terminase [Ligilactobacillus agilis]|uniref:Terminase n=1 Tax=Ligilactobacillus agilis TaxID=1601 RepID=A0A6F9XIL4_9LACO|nr:terminase small subunit [Ligilactobacillus agilis]GET05104.1 terminase [Ligilactobacillus agilis]
MDKKKQVRLDYETGMKYKEIAAKYNISINTVKSWRSRGKWQRNATKNKKSAPKRKKLHPKIEKVAPLVDEEAKGLTDKQKLFCAYYVKSFNAIQSYIKAYDVSYDTAHSAAYRMLANVGIKSYITELKKKRAQEIELETEDLLAKQIKIAFSDIADYLDFGSETHTVFDDDGNPVLDYETGEQKTYTKDYVHLKDIDKMDTSLIKSIRVSKKDGVQLELQDQSKALDWLLKFFALGEKEKAGLSIQNLKVAIKAAKAKMDAMNGDWDKRTYEVDRYLDLLVEGLEYEQAKQDTNSETTKRA